MADFRIVIVVDPTRARQGTKQVERQLDRVGKSADRTRQLIARAFAFVGIAEGIRRLISLTDTYTNMQNRLRTVTVGTAQLVVVTKELFKIADATRASFAGTAELYARMGLASKELGVSQRQLLNFTKSVNQAIILSGASAREANAGLIQLSQGLASGTLRGDELRSVLEQLPVIADVIAKSMGKTRGELRRLGSEGKITADIVLNAFKEAREELEERFAKTVPTIGQSFQVVSNNVIRLIGKFNESSGVAKIFSRALLDMAANMETLMRVVAAAGIAIGTRFAVQGVMVAVKALGAFTIALLANPFTAFITALSIVISLLIAFGDQIEIGEGRLGTFQDFGVAVFEALGRAVDSFIQFFDDNFGFIAILAKDTFDKVELSVAGVARTGAKTVDTLVGLFKGAGDAIVIAFEDLPASIEIIFIKIFNNATREYTKFFNLMVEGINSITDLTGFDPIKPLKAFELEAGDAAKGIGSRMDQAIADGIAGQHAAEDELDNILDRTEALATERLERQRVAQAAAEKARRALEDVRSLAAKVDPAFAKALELLRKEGEILKLNNQEREIQQKLLSIEKTLKRDLTEAERSLAEALVRSNQALADERALLDDIRGPVETYERSLAALTRLLDQGAISTKEFTDKQRELRLAVLDTATDLESGMERAFLRMKDDTLDLASTVEDTMVSAFGKAEDAFVEFVQTGKLNFTDLVNSIMADITRLAVKSALADVFEGSTGGGAGLGGGLGRILSGIFGSGGGGEVASQVDTFSKLGGGGGFFAGLSSLFGFANGGSFQVAGTGGVDKNVLSVNNKPVARVSRGETVNVSPNGSGGRPVQVTMNIQTPDANSFQRSQEQILTRTQAALTRAQRRNA